MPVIFTMAAKLIASRILSTITDSLVDDFIKDKGDIKLGEVESEYFERQMIEWLNEQIDIPFLSETAEAEVFTLVVHGFKSMILLKLNF